MLESLILNSLDVINLMYLWTILMKKKDDKLKLVSIVIVVSILTMFIQSLDVNFICEYVVSIIIIKIIYKINLKDITLSFLLVILINMSLQLIFTMFIEKLVYNNTSIIVFTELAILISTIIFSKSNLGINVNFNTIDNNIIIYFMLIYGIYAVVFKIIWKDDRSIILNNLIIISPILMILTISQALAYLYVVKLEKEKLKLKVSNEYNQVIDEIVQEIKQRQHDFINYKNTIKGIIDVVDEKDVREAINNYIKDEDVYDNKVNELIYIENVIIRSIIYRNMCKFKKYNIDFNYEIENNVLDNILGYHEMSNVLNNLLNNAFEEVIKEECVKKNVEVKIFNENNTAHLVVKNQVAKSNSVNLNEIFTRGYSTKEASTRGYGLHNVQTIINSHKGDIKINLEGGEIIFDIYFL